MRLFSASEWRETRAGTICAIHSEWSEGRDLERPGILHDRAIAHLVIYQPGDPTNEPVPLVTGLDVGGRKV
jgi:hypothetical protein